MVALSSLAGAGWQFFDNNGVPLAGGKLYTYAAGTTTPATTYTSNTGLTPNSNPIILDSSGRISNEIWLPNATSYKFRLDTANDVTLWTKDHIPGIFADKVLTASDISFTGFKGQTGTVADLADADGSDWIGFTQSGVDAVARSAQDKMRDVVSPKDFGAVGYATAAAALAGTDSTLAMQKMANAAALRGAKCDGENLWYKVTTVEWPSGSFAQNIKCMVPNTNADSAPFFVNGQVSTKSNITFVDCEVNGNRVGRTNMTSSGGDGQSFGFSIFGRSSNISFVRCISTYCATEGFIVWTGSVVPSNADDILHSNVQFLDCYAAWNGRHGLSLTSHAGTVIQGGKYTNNGKDIPGFASGVYSDGGYGRRLPANLSGNLYGRGITHEEFYAGEQFIDFTLDGVDARGNIGGVLIYHKIFTPVRSCKNLAVLNSQMDDPTGAGGDGSFILYVQDMRSGSGIPYTGTDAYDNVLIASSVFGRNALYIYSAQNVTISGCKANISIGGYSIIWTSCANVRGADIKSNKPQFDRPSMISHVGTTLPAGWTEGSITLTTPRDLPGSIYTNKYTSTITPTGAATQRIILEFTAGYDYLPLYGAALNNVTGAPIPCAIFDSNAILNGLDVWVTTSSANPFTLSLSFTAEPTP